MLHENREKSGVLDPSFPVDVATDSETGSEWVRDQTGAAVTRFPARNHQRFTFHAMGPKKNTVHNVSPVPRFECDSKGDV